MRAITNDSNMGGMTPTGTKSITTNGTHDVTEYAEANVQVPVGSRIVYLGTGTSINVKAKLPNDYQKLTNANFIVGVSGASATRGPDNGASIGGYPDAYMYGFKVSKSYNASTGVLTISGRSTTITIFTSGSGAQSGSNKTVSFSGFAYAVIGEIET